MKFTILLLTLIPLMSMSEMIECTTHKYKSGVRLDSQGSRLQGDAFEPLCQVDCNGVIGLIKDDKCSDEYVYIDKNTVLYTAKRSSLDGAYLASGTRLSLSDAQDLYTNKTVVKGKSIKNAIEYSSASGLNCSLFSSNAYIAQPGTYNELKGYSLEQMCNTNKATAKCVLKEKVGVCDLKFSCQQSGNVAGYGSIDSSRSSLTAVCNAHISSSEISCPSLEECIPYETGDDHMKVYRQQKGRSTSFEGINIINKKIQNQ